MIGLCVLVVANAMPRPTSFLAVSEKGSLRQDQPGYMQKPATAPVFNATGDIKIGDVTLKTEYPQDYNHFMQGLMWRDSLCDGCSMAFPWKKQQSMLSFWMDNTKV